MKHIAPDRVARFISDPDDLNFYTAEELSKLPSGPRPLSEIDMEYRKKQAKLAAEKAKKPE